VLAHCIAVFREIGTQRARLRGGHLEDQDNVLVTSKTLEQTMLETATASASAVAPAGFRQGSQA
jgi:hypothetical protein